MKRREQIIARLVEIAKTVVAPEAVYRDREAPETEIRPAIVVLSGEFSRNSDADPPGADLGGLGAYFLRPDIFIHTIAPTPEEGAPEISALAEALDAAIFADAQLAAILGGDGWVTLEGGRNSTGVGADVELEMALEYRIHFVDEAG